MKRIILMILLNYLCAQSKYPADTLLLSTETPMIHRIGLLPISLWQRISYNTNLLNCQFYPSCSNYGADAISRYGILRGGVIATERITRCNPFAYNYHLELGNPFNEKDGRLIDPIKQQDPILSKRSPFIAAILSAIIPGAGRAYSGRTMDGIMGFWTFYLTGSSAYFSIKEDRPVAGPLFGVAVAFVYIGEIYGAWRSAKYYQKNNIKEPPTGFEPATYALRMRCSTN